MTETNEETQAPTPDHKTFNIIDALQGVNYPEEQVTVFLDDSVMYLKHKAERQLALEELRPDNEERIEELRNSVDNLLKQAENVKFTFCVRAVPRDTHKAILASLEKDYPVKKDVFGREEKDPIRDEAFMAKLWAAHITRIESPSGEIQMGVSEDEAATLRGYLPSSSLEAIQVAMDELYEGAKKGYESALQETNFLSGASQEA